MRWNRPGVAPFALCAAIAGAGIASAAPSQDWRTLDPAASIPSASSAPEEPKSLSRSVSSPPFGQVVAPFALPGEAPTHDRALDCLTAAVYYEAATEPREGQEAVAQVVLNRLRHPAFPKSVCGVVYDGVGAASTCQFTFACDGSTLRLPNARLWQNARDVAQAALSGHVATQVGAATHYHAVYVSPYWRTSLTPVGRIGNHLFYSMPGWRGTALALTGQYSGFEPDPPPLPQRAGFPSPATRAANPGERSVAFTVWGLPIAIISAKKGQITVKPSS